MKLTPQQRSKIFALQRQHGMTKEELYAVVHQVSGGDSISALTKEQAIKLIDRLDRLSGKKPEPRAHRATDAMIGKIRQLERELGWSDDPKRLQGFMKKYTGVDRLNWLTKRQAGGLIEGLKQMCHRVHDRFAETKR